ncbi:MAG: hypothetical protein ABIH28_01500 [archaeon]
MVSTPLPSKLERIHLDNGLKVDVPRYSIEQLPPYNCARYARLSSHFIFGKEFPVAHAWQMREKTIVVSRLNENSQMTRLIEKKIISPGMLLGVFCEDSMYLNERRSYTHLGLYIGQQSKNPLILEQFGEEIRLADLRCYALEGLKIKEVLNLKH